MTTDEILFALQERTKVTLMMCKVALMHSNYDIDKAEQIVKERLKSSSLMTDSHWK